MARISDVLIIGSGVAGLSIAIKLALKRSDLKIMVVSKTELGETNTRYAQGGIAAVWNQITDNHEKHIADTLDAGDGLCDKEIVRLVVEEGPTRVEEIIEWGTRFDKDKEGQFDLGKEGGHTANRILHYKDITGKEIQRALVNKVRELENVILLEEYFAINLITQHDLGRLVTRVTPDICCFGAYIMDRKNRDIETFLSKTTVLATGGAGQIYSNTTNPVIATGDGIAMLYRAKGRLANMEFIQFHPTALYNPAAEGPDFLISEAVRGFGATLRTRDGSSFMEKYDDRGSLAPRDIVARAIDNEMKVRGDDYVYLDCTQLEADKFLEHFPNITEQCRKLGIDPLKDFIPVVPACHYVCGGALINEHGQTSIHNLFAAGECTASGLHGANRLASNSLLEGLVFGHRVSEEILRKIDEINIQVSIPDWDTYGTNEPKEMVLITQSWRELKEIMSYYVGIVRTNTRLKRAKDRLYLLYKETEELYNTTTLSPQLCELRNLITIGFLVTSAAQMRTESRGLHFNTDFPDKNDFIEYTYQ